MPRAKTLTPEQIVENYKKSYMKHNAECVQNGYYRERYLKKKDEYKLRYEQEKELLKQAYQCKKIFSRELPQPEAIF